MPFSWRVNFSFLFSLFFFKFFARKQLKRGMKKKKGLMLKEEEEERIEIRYVFDREVCLKGVGRTLCVFPRRIVENVFFSVYVKIQRG